MKNKIVFFASTLILILNLFTAAQQLPTGNRLKNIPSNIRVGSLVVHGYNTDPSGLLEGINTSKVANIVNTEYNLGTATCYPKWEGWATQGVFNYTQFNKVINWLHDRGKLTIMHMLCGPDQYFPDWFVQGNWNATQQDSLLRSWIYGIIESNNNIEKVDVWNVVNEAFEFNKDNGNYWSNSKVKFHDLGFEQDVSGLTGADKVNTQHPIYIRKAFEYAADKTDKILELRENSIEFGGRKAKAFYQLVRHLLNKGVPLGAVGLQCHFDIGNVNATLLKSEIKKYSDLGIQVYLNELDVGNTTLPFTADKAAQQKKDFYDITKVAIETDVAGIVTWGITDKNEYWRTNENCLAFTENFEAKPAYYGIQQAMQEASNTFNNVTTGKYIITAKHSGMVMQVNASNTNDGAYIVQANRVNTTAQQWEITSTEGGFHKVISVLSGKGLDISGISCRDGALLQQWSFGGGDNQLWKFEKQPSGFYKIYARHSNKALDVMGVSNNNGANIQQWRFGGGNNQLWSLERLNTTTNKIASTQKLPKLELLPNPSVGNTAVIYNNSEELELASLQITNAQGIVILQKQFYLQRGINTHKINTELWAKGIYVIKLLTEKTKHELFEKLIVE